MPASLGNRCRPSRARIYIRYKETDGGDDELCRPYRARFGAKKWLCRPYRARPEAKNTLCSHYRARPEAKNSICSQYRARPEAKNSICSQYNRYLTTKNNERYITVGQTPCEAMNPRRAAPRKPRRRARFFIVKLWVHIRFNINCIDVSVAQPFPNYYSLANPNDLPLLIELFRISTSFLASVIKKIPCVHNICFFNDKYVSSISRILPERR